ncbi:MAG: helix-turn-helix transcriptional regulator [Alphaproteobacteria bacterium]|nr:helix-turn-helix transcriptional regulator [Alphaproteobacteria bacterium]
MIGEALRLIRIFHDCKTTDLAEALGLSASHISEIESGKKKPSLETLEKYASFFETSLSVILYFSEELDKSTKKDNIRSKIIKFLQAVERTTT